MADTMTDRERLEAVAKGYTDLMALERERRATMAKMIRACLQRLRTPSQAARKEAMDGLRDLAEMLEKDPR